MNAGTREHAVVLGASMAGLLAAKVLAEHYRHVTVMDRDTLEPDATPPRRGVPQGAHVHAVVGRGQQALEGLLRGLPEELVSGGAGRGDQLHAARLHFS